MVLATLLLVCSIPQMDDTAKVMAASNANAEQPAVSAVNSPSNTKDSKDATGTAVLPVAPEPKVKTDADPAALRSALQPFQPVRPATRPYETPRQRKTWYALTIIGSSGAAFDAWSTRRAISGGYGQEANPFLRPFANSNALYAATQVSPAIMDFIGKRLMVSEHRWVRKIWWVPQTAGASFSFVAAAHNVSVVH
ncbi:MAG TPA: hypothetical protein VE263_22600 [Candidatus Angelobacter sp.]|nr:hypothetical protein [Candidatus Angelobacter sp.]